MPENCFALREQKCAVLRVSACFGKGKCAFYKTISQYNADKLKSSERINNLGKGDKIYINDKYYGAYLNKGGEHNGNIT